MNSVIGHQWGGIKHLLFDRVMRDLVWYELEKKCLQEDVSAFCQYLHQEGHQEDKARFIKVEHGGMTRDHRCKTKRDSKHMRKNIQKNDNSQTLKRVVLGTFQDHQVCPESSWSDLIAMREQDSYQRPFDISPNLYYSKIIQTFCFLFPHPLSADLKMSSISLLFC